MSAKQAIHDKLQGVVVGLWITELRKVYCWICEWIFLNRWIFGKVTSKSVVVSCTSRAWPTHCEKTKKVYDFDSVELFNCEQVRRTVSCSESSTSARHWRLKSTTTRRGGGNKDCRSPAVGGGARTQDTRRWQIIIIISYNKLRLNVPRMPQMAV